MTFGHIDEVLRHVEQSEPDRKLVAARLQEYIAALGLQVDEATGNIVPKAPAYTAPDQTHVRFAGMLRRGRRR